MQRLTILFKNIYFVLPNEHYDVNLYHKVLINSDVINITIGSFYP